MFHSSVRRSVLTACAVFMVAGVARTFASQPPAQVSTLKFTDIAVNPAFDEGRFVKPVAKSP